MQGLLRVVAGAGSLAAICVALTTGVASCSKHDAGNDTAAQDRIAKGSQLYADLCSTCHGKMGEGVTGPSLRDWKRGEPVLTDTIDKRMPLGNPEKCTGECATDIAEYILATFNGAIICQGQLASPRVLRLLTRREYLNTVTDLVGASPGTGTTPPAPVTACDTITFTYNPAGRTLTSVHVAGSFNGWPQTVAAGGWPLALAGGMWTGSHTVPQGASAYKFVLNESEWIVDPTDPNTVSDGFGGQNSSLAVSCPVGGADGGTNPLPFDPTSGFPQETRPQGFAFDDNGPGRIVTSVHVEEYLRASAAIAAATTQNLKTLVGCDYAANLPACAEQFATTFGKRAFRRPMNPTEIARYKDLIVKQKDAPTGFSVAIRAMLASSSFLYRSELGDLQPDGTYRLNPYEVASALSYMFWASMPDQALFDAAASGELSSPAGIEKHARRLLASPRAREVIAVFGEQWLGAENVSESVKSDLFPEFTTDMRASMREETRRFVQHVVFDSTHKYDELLTANYTFANESLAKIYGMPAVTGTDLKKVPYPDASRSGVLGQASILATTAHSDQTSPIRRGLFVRRNLLCQEFGTPPPNAGGLPMVDPNATTRERFAQHTANPVCASCHKYIDSIGFGFERFDPIGKLRDTENGKPIDSSGDMNDVEQLGAGTDAPFSSLSDLGKVLVGSQAAKGCFVRQVYRFSRGFRETSDDLCAITSLQSRFKDSGSDVQELLIAITQSPEFLVRR